MNSKTEPIEHRARYERTPAQMQAITRAQAAGRVNPWTEPTKVDKDKAGTRAKRRRGAS